MKKYIILLCVFVNLVSNLLTILRLDPNLFQGDLVLSPEQLNAVRHGSNGFAAVISNPWPSTTIAWTGSKEICRFISVDMIIYRIYADVYTTIYMFCELSRNCNNYSNYMLIITFLNLFQFNASSNYVSK